MYRKRAYVKSGKHLIHIDVFPKRPHFTPQYHGLAESESLLNKIHTHATVFMFGTLPKIINPPQRLLF